MKFAFMYIMALMAAAMFAQQAKAEEASQIMAGCYQQEVGHADVRKCLERGEANSQSRLDAATQHMLAALAAKDAAAEDIARVRAAFKSARPAYITYRRTWCDFYASLSMGGNTAQDGRLACMQKLNDERAAELEQQANRLEGKK